MGTIDRVLPGLLHDGVDFPIVTIEIAPLIRIQFIDTLDVEQGLGGTRVIPGPDDAVDLLHWIAANDRLACSPRGNLAGVGYRGAPSLGIELPAVKRASDVLALDLAAYAEVRAEVGTIGIQQHGLTGFCAKQHQVLAEIPQGLHVPDVQVPADSDTVPAVRNGKFIAHVSIHSADKVSSYYKAIEPLINDFIPCDGSSVVGYTATMSKTNDLRELLQGSSRAVVFTGAGISTESGIPDFRGPGGLWTRIKPIDFSDFIASDEVRQQSWRQWFDHGQGLRQAEPNAGHYAVARLVDEGKVTAVITQNVDNLHQDSGVPSQQVIELHGNATYARCLDCGVTLEMDDLEREFRDTGKVGPCSTCGGIVKSATISFGQMMPEEPMQRAQMETLACDLFVVLGSSLTVYPAAAFPELARQNGAGLVIVNNQATDLDPVADLVIHEGIGETMTAALD
jgi:NAD-dependent deacetylase